MSVGFVQRRIEIIETLASNADIRMTGMFDA